MTIFRPLGFAVGLTLLAVPTFALPMDDAQDTFNNGIQLLNRGQEEKALHEFQKVLAMDLSNEAAYKLFSTTDSAIWLDMLMREGDMQIVTQRLMSMAKLRRTEQRDDADAIRGLVRAATGEDLAARMTATNKLSIDHGEYAVKYLLNSLGKDADTDRRVMVMNLLTSMGDDVVLPLCAALDTKDEFLRRNVAVTLGYIGDDRAAAHLSRLAEMDTDEGVRTAAAAALASCGGAAKGAEHAFMMMGLNYHLADMKVLRPYQYSDVVWSFGAGELSSTMVPRYLYSEELAKVSFYNALRVNPASKGALSGLARVYASEMQKIEDRAASGLEVGGEAAQAKAGMLAVAAAGSRAIDGGLLSSIRADDQMAAVGLCRAVQMGLAVGGDGLVKALAEGNPSLQGEAALAMAAQARGPMTNNNVVEALGVAAGRTTSRIAAVIGGNGSRAGAAASALMDQDMLVNHWSTGAKGLANLYRVPGLDVILVADRLSDLTTDQVISEIQASSTFGETPIVILAQNADQAEELYGDRVAGIIGTNDFSSVKGYLSESKGRDRDRADSLSSRSSDALAALAASGSDVSAALPMLETTLSGRSDAVMLSALGAIGACGNAGTAVKLAELVSNSGASDEVREAAAMACAEIFGRGNSADGILDGLIKVVGSDAPLSVRSAIAAALGRLDLEASVRAKLMMLVRVNVGE
jgi:HEAT repeat protein